MRAQGDESDLSQMHAQFSAGLRVERWACVRCAMDAEMGGVCQGASGGRKTEVAHEIRGRR